MSELYNLNASDDTSAWNTHEIRSHRKPRRRLIKRRTILAAMVIAIGIGAGAPVTMHGTVQPAQAEVIQLAPRVEAIQPPRSSTVSRSMARVESARTKKLNRVINYALAQRGDRYRFGAAGPSRWDCSGLVMVSYRQIGIKLPHFTGGMLKHGKHISRRNLQRGDLVFPSNHHVGIYLGGGKMIVASSGHGHVMIQKIYAFYAGRRLI